MSTYRNHVEPLVSEQFYEPVFYFEFSPARSYYEDFFEFAKNNLLQHFNSKKDASFYFMYVDSEVKNAFAEKRENGSCVIGINKGLFEWTIRLNLENLQFLAEIPHVEHVNSVGLFNGSFQNYFSQWIMIFLYYHELGHLIQFSEATSRAETERYSLLADEFELEKHIREIDSDLFAIHKLLLNHQLNFIPDNLIIDEQDGILDSVMILVIVMVFILFDILGDSKRIELPVYLEKYSHPHPVVRILAIVNHVMIIFKRKFPKYTFRANLANMLSAFEIVDRIMVSNSFVPRFIEYYQVEEKNINDYTEFLLKMISMRDDLAMSQKF